MLLRYIIFQVIVIISIINSAEDSENQKYLSPANKNEMLKVMAKAILIMLNY